MKEKLFTFETRAGIRWARTAVVLTAMDHRTAFAMTPKDRAGTLAKWAVNRALLQINGRKAYEVDEAPVDAKHLILVGYGEREEGFSLTQLAR